MAKIDLGTVFRLQSGAEHPGLCFSPAGPGAERVHRENKFQRGFIASSKELFMWPKYLILLFAYHFSKEHL